MSTQKQTANVTIEFNTNATFTGNLEGYTYNKDTNSFVSSEGVATGVEGTLVSIDITNSIGNDINSTLTTAFAEVADKDQAEQARVKLIETLNALPAIKNNVKNVVIDGYNDVVSTSTQTVNLTIEFNSNVTLTGTNDNFQAIGENKTILKTKDGIATKIKGTLVSIDITNSIGNDINSTLTTAFAEVADKDQAEQARVKLIETLNALPAIKNNVKNVVIDGYNDVVSTSTQTVNLTIEFNSNVTLTGTNDNFQAIGENKTILKTKDGIATKIKGTKPEASLFKY